MGLFSKKKKDVVVNEEGEEMAMCDCGNMCKTSDIEAKRAAEELASKTQAEEGLGIKVLGTGCKKCNDLTNNAKAALDQAGLANETIEHITDMAQIAAYGVMSTPALVVGGKVVSMGRVLTPTEIAKFLI